MISLFFNLMRFGRAVWRSMKDPEFRALLVVFLLMLVSGTAFYTRVEGWSVLDALYFSVATMATVSYGNFVPQTALGKVFAIVYLVGVGVFFALVAKLAQSIIQRSEPPAASSKDIANPNEEKSDNSTSGRTRRC